MRWVEVEVIRPLTIVFVRHGESEANIAQLSDKRGDTSHYTEDFRKKPNSQMRLTEIGVSQAEAAGKWIRENINGGVFDGYYVSSFTRARHTAGHLCLPEAEDTYVWKIRDYLREQDWGHLDGLTTAERYAKYPEIMEGRVKDRFYWPGFGGESMADLVFRTKVGIIATLYREHLRESAIAVSHGQTMWAVRNIMEGLTEDKYRELDSAQNPLEKMNNCQILQYTRIDPEDEKHIDSHLSWMRTVCPWDMSRSRNEWVRIERPKFTNAQLLDS